MIVAETVKGKGVPSMEDQGDWHSLGAPLSGEEVNALLAELEGARR